MNNEEAKNQPAALWEKAKSMYLGTLNGEDEKSQAERYFSMVATVSFENGKFTIIATNSFAAVSAAMAEAFDKSLTDDLESSQDDDEEFNEDEE